MKKTVLIYIVMNGIYTVHATNTLDAADLEIEHLQEVEKGPAKEAVLGPVRKSERIAKQKEKLSADIPISEDNVPDAPSQPPMEPIEDKESPTIKKKRGRPAKGNQDVLPISAETMPTGPDFASSLDTTAIETPPKKRGRPKKNVSPLLAKNILDTQETPELKATSEVPDRNQSEYAVGAVSNPAQYEPSLIERAKQKTYSGLSQAGSSLKHYVYKGVGHLKNTAQDTFKTLSDKFTKYRFPAQDAHPESLNTETPIKEIPETKKRGRGRPKKSPAPTLDTIVPVPDIAPNTTAPTPDTIVPVPSFTERLKQNTYSRLAQAGSSLKHNVYTKADDVKNAISSGVAALDSGVNTAKNYLKAYTPSVPKGLKNLAQNLSYRYLKGTGDAIKRSFNLLKNYLDIGAKVGNRLKSDVGKVADVVTDTTTGAITGGFLGGAVGMFTSVAKGAASFGVESVNPWITTLQTVQSLSHLGGILKTFFSFYQAVEYGGVNFISDTGRNITSFGKHALNFFKDPEEFKVIVDNYVLEKYFKWIVRLGIFSFGIVQAVEFALPEIATIPELAGKTTLLLNAVKAIPDTLSAYFKPVTDAGSWRERAVALKDVIFNSNIQMKKMQQFVLNTHKSILTTLNEFSLMDEKVWEKEYPGIASMISGFKGITSTVSSGIDYETGRLENEISVNEKVTQVGEALSNAKSTFSNAASAVSDAAYGALNTMKNWFY